MGGNLKSLTLTAASKNSPLITELATNGDNLAELEKPEDIEITTEEPNDELPDFNSSKQKLNLPAEKARQFEEFP